MGDNYREYVTHPDEKGNIHISEEVITVIAANAVLDTEGVAALATGTADRQGKKRVIKGVRLYVEDEIVMVDAWIIAKAGVSVNATATKVQESVKSNIESMTGFTVSEVNVHVCGVAQSRAR